MNILLTGGAGFIGSYISKRFAENNKVIIIDNLLLGYKNKIDCLNKTENIKFYNEDVCNKEKVNEIFRDNKIDVVIHLAANSDIQKSEKDPDTDFHNTFLTTYTLLECMRVNNVKNLIFASTSAVYGDKRNELINEDCGPLFPISYYGGAKLASEAFISSYTYMNNMNTCVFRFPNVIGENLTHGVVYDFINKLKNNSKELIILGDGMQEKSYIYVEDLIDAILYVFDNKKQGLNYFNIGANGTTSVKSIADIICEEMKLHNVEYKYTGGECGWKGDVPKFNYDTTKINDFGWKAKYISDEAIRLSVKGALKLCK
ncbi:NAD-dependent epimerase/dehydratase family protein [Clostridium butyricum]|uniref:NAD-dependent epimerase/dehydratase family protein n=1 Tax=Clostridium butyricum TaxID=1492 RepID=UPI0013D3AB4E|nr:NAD-dependent epimerase/dehydratase family protein [Clostridium butyricum]MCQ2022952.1 NAD-dependent epimerase/dehydratase family protein [Clostridium butyricum]NFB70102.1 NAD-dependent epimerase/dehydratase family protein [Clostridium butyricum]NFB89889.1 NAD-dependent epimerase/dehydratase family protein [Clostridium butyricum]